MRLLLLLVAAVIAVLAGVAALQISNKSLGKTPIIAADASQKVTTVDVLVAKTAIPEGTVITQDMLDKQPWPENLVLKGFIVSGSADADIVGKVTRSAFQVREPLIVSKLSSLNEAGFLAAHLPPGKRAVTIATDAVSGVAGFIFPGDRVDVLFTHNIPNDLNTPSAEGGASARASSDKPAFTEVLVADVSVLAINIREAVNREDGGVVPVGNATSSTTPSSMTLQVSDVQAEQLRLAEKVGTLSLSLRSLSDRKNHESSRPVDLTDLTQAHVTEAQQEDNTVKVIRR